METTLKSAPVWIVPEGPGVPNVPALGSATGASLRGTDHPSPVKRATPGGATREYRIPNLARACQVLRLFASSFDHLSSSSVARQLKMPRTTVLRILHTLAAERLLQRRGFDFTASPELRTGLRSIADTALRAAAVPVLNEISQLTGETACLALLAGDKVAVVETCDSPYAARVGSGLGASMDLHCAAFGKVFLAFGPRVIWGQCWPVRRCRHEPADPHHVPRRWRPSAARSSGRAMPWTMRNTRRVCAAWPHRFGAAAVCWRLPSACRPQRLPSLNREPPTSPR